MKKYLVNFLAFAVLIGMTILAGTYNNDAAVENKTLDGGDAVLADASPGDAVKTTEVSTGATDKTDTTESTENSTDKPTTEDGSTEKTSTEATTQKGVQIDTEQIKKIQEKQEEYKQDIEEAQKLIDDAKMLEEIGCYALVLEKIPAALAKRVTESVGIPTIGIGAGVGCDGQVLVIQDMLGMNMGFKPKFLRQYNNLGEQIIDSVNHYVEDVKNGLFPNEAESY